MLFMDTSAAFQKGRLFQTRDPNKNVFMVCRFDGQNQYANYFLSDNYHFAMVNPDCPFTSKVRISKMTLGKTQKPKDGAPYQIVSHSLKQGGGHAEESFLSLVSPYDLGIRQVAKPDRIVCFPHTLPECIKQMASRDRWKNPSL